MEPPLAGPLLAQVHRDLDAPLYAQIQRELEISIATNRLRPGDMVPGEVELANRYGVSRVTVRQALSELAAEGLLYRIQGKGTFVSAPMIQRAEPNITSFFLEMRESGRKPTAQSSSEVVKPDAETVRRLRLQPTELVILTRRLRFVDDEPIAYQVNTTRYSLCPGLEKHDFATQSFQRILEVYYGVRVAVVDEALASAMPDEQLAKLLQIPGTVPVLIDDRTLCNTSGEVIGSSRAYFRGDRYTYKIVYRLPRHVTESSVAI
jgi:GntR family transcriptional regulator